MDRPGEAGRMTRLPGRQVAVRFVRDANINLQAFDMWQAAFVNYPDTPWRRSAVAYLQARPSSRTSMRV